MNSLIPLLETRGQKLRWKTTGLLAAPRYEVWSSAGMVAILETDEDGADLLGQTRDQTWRFTTVSGWWGLAPGFHRETSGLVPDEPGMISSSGAVTFADQAHFDWMRTSFWRSRYGYCASDESRCLIEYSVGHVIRVFGTVMDSGYLPVLLFLGVLHRAVGKPRSLLGPPVIARPGVAGEARDLFT